jgi:serine/threonine-protein kinase
MAGLGRLARCACLTPLLCLALHASPARAQATAADKAAAEALFDQGLRLMKQSNFAEACPKLEESNRIDPAVGTLLYLGECFERVGKTASAWATFREAASLADTSNQADRARVASGRAQELETKLSRLTVELAPEVSRIPGVVVKRGTQRLEPSLYGTPLPVDPGEYRIEVSAPGYETWSTPITVGAAGASASVRVPQLVKGAEPPTAAAPPSGSSARATSSGPPAPVATMDQGMSTQQTLGLVVGGVGLVGVGLGSYFGIRAISRNSDAEKDCRDDGGCETREAVTLSEDARQDARFANIFFAAGGVLVATGAVLYLTGGSSSADRVALVPVVGPQLAAASVTGRF